MRNFFLIVLLAAALFYGYRYWYAPAPDAASTSEGGAASASATPNLADLGTYFLLDYYSIRTEHGISAWTPGQELKVVPATDNPPGRVLVTDGQMKEELDRTQLTRDIDLAAKLRANDAAGQARAKKEIAAAKAKIEADRRRAETMSANDLDAARARQRAGLPPATPVPAKH